VLHELPRAGTKDPRVREYLRLKRRPSATAPGAVALEGAWAVRQACVASIRLDVVFVCPELARRAPIDTLVGRLRDAGTDVLAVSAPVLRRMAERDGPDGFVAIARLPVHRLDNLVVTRATCVVIAADIESAGNLGTLVRTADGAGASAVIVTGGRTRPTHPLVVRASIGTAFAVPIVEADDSDVVAWLPRHGMQLIAADPSARTSYREMSYCRPLAIVVGNERLGLSAVWREAANAVVSIPMLGTADSLNVAVAGALVLYEAALTTAQPST
jgi:RNA methyltransferase, TrmH family